MPQRMWDHSECCGNFRSATPECGDEQSRGRYAGWSLTMHESMARYQYVYGLKPIGLHRSLAEQLLAPLRAPCPRCDRNGVLDYDDGASCGLCPVCEGTGGSWSEPDDVVNARRRTILETFPDAGAPSVRFFDAPLALKTPQNVMVNLGDSPPVRPRSEVVLAVLGALKEGDRSAGEAGVVAEVLAQRLEVAVEDVECALEVLRGFRMIRLWTIVETSGIVLGKVAAPDRVEAMRVFALHFFTSDHPLAEGCYFNAVEVTDEAAEPGAGPGPDSGFAIEGQTQMECGGRLKPVPQEEVDPWGHVTPAQFAAVLDQALAEDPALPPASGRLFKAATGLTLAEALVSLAADPDEANEALWHLRTEEVVARFTAEPLSVVIDCCVSSSMVSGSWSVLEFRIGDRGYLYFSGDEGQEDGLLGAWEPVMDQSARRACLLATYLREWKERSLPPYAEWATGEPGLLEEAILHVLDAEPEEWGLVLGFVSRMDDLPRDAVERIARVGGFSPEDIRKVFESLKGGEQEPSNGDRRIAVALYVQQLARDPYGFLRHFAVEE